MTPSKPSLASLGMISGGKCEASSHSITCGAISASANSRTVRRSCCCSSVSEKSTAPHLDSTSSFIQKTLSHSRGAPNRATLRVCFRCRPAYFAQRRNRPIDSRAIHVAVRDHAHANLSVGPDSTFCFAKLRGNLRRRLPGSSHIENHDVRCTFFGSPTIPGICAMPSAR